VGSREADVAGGDLRLFSDEEVFSPRSVCSVQLGSPKRHPMIESTIEPWDVRPL